MWRDIWSLVEMLLVVVLILFLAYWTSRWVGSGGFRRFSAGGAPGVPGGCGLRILGQLGLGRDQRLLLVELQGQCVLLGVTQQQITLLKELDPAQAEELLQRVGEPSPPPSFLDVWKETLRKKK